MILRNVKYNNRDINELLFVSKMDGVLEKTLIDNHIVAEKGDHFILGDSEVSAILLFKYITSHSIVNMTSWIAQDTDILFHIRIPDSIDLSLMDIIDMKMDDVYDPDFYEEARLVHGVCVSHVSIAYIKSAAVQCISMKMIEFLMTLPPQESYKVCTDNYLIHLYIKNMAEYEKLRAKFKFMKG